MNNFFITLLKALGVLALSAFIFFLFMPKDRIKDQAVDLAMEFLGKRLLAMVPKEHEQDIEKKFEAVQEKALKGEINDQHLQEFTTIVLNAEAEGHPLALARIDSALQSLHENQMAFRADAAQRAGEEARLEEWAKRMQEYEQFEKRWHTLLPDSTAIVENHTTHRPPLPYRVSKQFVVQIDSAALANTIAMTVVGSLDSMPPFPPPDGHFPPPEHFRTIVRQLGGNLRGLRVELHSRELTRQLHRADSLRAHTRIFVNDRPVLTPEMPQVPVTPKAAPPSQKN